MMCVQLKELLHIVPLLIRCNALVLIGRQSILSQNWAIHTNISLASGPARKENDLNGQSWTLLPCGYYFEIDNLAYSQFAITANNFILLQQM